MMPEEIVRDLNQWVRCIRNFRSIICTGILGCRLHDLDTKGRFPDAEYEKVAGIYTIKSDDLANAPSNLMIMHPLPRVMRLP